MTTTKPKTYVGKSFTVGLDDTTLKSIEDAAKTVGAPKDANVALGGGVLKAADSEEYHQYSATFSWHEEV